MERKVFNEMVDGITSDVALLKDQFEVNLKDSFREGMANIMFRIQQLKRIDFLEKEEEWVITDANSSEFSYDAGASVRGPGLEEEFIPAAEFVDEFTLVLKLEALWLKGYREIEYSYLGDIVNCYHEVDESHGLLVPDDYLIELYSLGETEFRFVCTYCDYHGESAMDAHRLLDRYTYYDFEEMDDSDARGAYIDQIGEDALTSYDDSIGGVEWKSYLEELDDFCVVESSYGKFLYF